MSVCESNCEYDGYNSSIKKAECDCEIKIKIPLMSEIIINKDKLLQKFVNIKSEINLSIMKCYSILFNLEELKNNIGNYIILSIIFIGLCSLFIVLFKGHKLLTDIIDSIFLSNKGINRNNSKKKPNKKNKGKSRKNKKNKKIQINKNFINIINIDKNFTNKNTKNNKIKKKKRKKSNLVTKNPPFKKKNKKYINFKKIYNNIVETNGEDKNDKYNSKLKINNSPSVKKKIKKSNLKESKINNNKKLLNYNDYELNSLNYKDAITIDKRSYIQYYFSLLRKKQLLIFTFYTYNDYNIRIIKICLFFFNFSLYYTVNALFFTDSTMNKIYKAQGTYNFIYQIPIILYSTLICNIINNLVVFLSLSEKNIISLKINKNIREENINKVLKCLKIKLSFFFILLFLFLLLFWYFISCFCAVYKNTQMHLIKDTLISFSFTLIIPFILYLFPGILRIPSLRSKKADKECLYNFSKYLQLI